ncbi:ABC-three component system middle component 8 [Xylella fastidiosa]|uniref:ABC-three component system middle component 8 n=1 Tax=Xylella fastidiosa TaxID=2371 RepID=UPI0003D39419|nr:ABC-three component system middle component 8 [Xylella fastidiosa]ALR01000.1 hypothetical protein OY18_00655 [Xylella fastidiosa]KXB14961.1 hypothetical protein ADT29_04930 [Xylella fastidiosa]KXB18980.1 hypothetical protein ADT28_11975 [Xylella fastidiosa]KXB20599.1 hypothetical protein ADT30_06195 [Xylella fastidiosa]MDG5823317.1 hypothetical protein [Xylella fastidiosa subsp. pauca]
MLRPTKHSHPDLTVINLSLLLLKRLRKDRFSRYDVLRALAKQRIVGGDVLFLPALNFLYLFGLIEYRGATDTVEYVRNNEVI